MIGRQSDQTEEHCLMFVLHQATPIVQITHTAEMAL